jgi:hypothetical protein
MPRKPRREQYAGQPLARLADAIDRAITKGALSGDAQMLAALQREVRAVSLGVCEPPPPPRVFRGKKQTVFELVLQGLMPQEIVERTKYSRATVYRLRKAEDFQTALDQARAHRVVASQEAAADLLPLAIQRLRGILLDPAASHRDVLSAFREVADRAGLPKTTRAEVVVEGAVGDEKRTDDELLAELEALGPQLEVLEGGKAG